MRAGRLILALSVAGIVAGCGTGDDELRLMNVRSTSSGPDEFSIVPPKSLEMPKDLRALPEPTPGGRNLTDQDPEADAIIALGGNPRAGVAGDAALVSAVSRNGVTQNVRSALAVEDLEHRQKNKGRFLDRLFGNNTYHRAYNDQSLDQSKEIWRWRSAGAKTPSAPPPVEKKR